MSHSDKYREVSLAESRDLRLAVSGNIQAAIKDARQIMSSGSRPALKFKYK